MPHPTRTAPTPPALLVALPMAVLVTLLVALLVAASTMPTRTASADEPLPGGGVLSAPGGYVGSLLLPPGARPDPPSLPGQAARCDGCVWTLVPACNRPAPGDALMCAGAALACPRPQQRVALWLQRPGLPVPVLVGTFCLGPGVALQPVQLVPGVRDRFAQLVPGLRPSFQPRVRGLVNLPVLFAAGQPTSLGRRSFLLGGRRVDLAATVAWLWDTGDGAVLRTRSPGGGWPVTDVGHAYRVPGSYSVLVTAEWSGQFWVDGAGPFTVTGGPVTQTARLVVPVVAARAQLVGGTAG